MLSFFTAFLLSLALLVSFAFPASLQGCISLPLPLAFSAPLALCLPLLLDCLAPLRSLISPALTLLLCSSHHMLRELAVLQSSSPLFSSAAA